MTKTRTGRSAAPILACALVFLTSVAGNAAAAPILSTGGPIHVTLVETGALLRSEVWLFAVNPGPSQNPLAMYSGAFLFPNHGSNTSAAPGSGGTAASGSPTGNLNPGGLLFPAGSELHFGIFVQDLFNPGFTNPLGVDAGVNTRGAWFYTGDGSSNFDGRIHAVVTLLAPNRYLVGFEDLCRTNPPEVSPNCADTRFTADWDFNDVMFEVTTGPVSVPEPGGFMLLTLGAGCALAARRSHGQRKK